MLKNIKTINLYSYFKKKLMFFIEIKFNITKIHVNIFYIVSLNYNNSIKLTSHRTGKCLVIYSSSSLCIFLALLLKASTTFLEYKTKSILSN